MNEKIKYWQHIILSKKQIEPKDAQELAYYKIAQYLLENQIKKEQLKFQQI